MQEVLSALTRLRDLATDRVRARVTASSIDREQLAAHALAYLSTEVEACGKLAAWAEPLGGHEQAIAAAYVGEVARTLSGGVDLGACESIPLADLGLEDADLDATLRAGPVQAFARAHAGGEAWLAIARAARDHGWGRFGLEDPVLDEIRAQFARYADAEVIPRAQEIHRRDVLIPIEMVRAMSELGVFGLTIPEEHGGLGLGKVAMCVVTEELSRGYIGVGSLGTRAEIAAELILGGGTEAQKKEWLPKIAAGEVLPTAVFTEPNFGSDLAHIATRAERQADGSYRVSGQKTWITHAVRADLMTLLARTDPAKGDHAGLSMFLAPKTRRGGDAGEAEFVDEGLTGTEIPVLGYRGMKEYELSFDGFVVPKGALLGDEEGAGFKQLMRTFESARIQTAARGVGLAQAALDDAFRYAQERIQFGKPIAEFPRVGRKLGRMVARTQAARQLTYHAARRKDSGDRCDLEAGMAKLLATRAAWEAADANVQIHGGNGYACEYLASRLLVDARVLSIFEGANEIQAHVIARRLLGS
jgi:(2S)-methylsuccinyl-CoA dehydrogenase